MKPSCQFLHLPAVAACLFIVACALPAAAQAPPAVEKNEWPEFTKVYPVKEIPRDLDETFFGHPLPPGEVMTPESVRKLAGADTATRWKLSDGTFDEFHFMDFRYVIDKEKNTAVFSLSIWRNDKSVRVPAARLHPDEYPRIRRLAWNYYFKQKADLTNRKEALPVQRLTVFHFAGSGLKEKERTTYATRPPGPEVPEADVATEPVWPAVQKWKLKDGKEVEFAYYRWEWLASSNPVVILRVVRAGDNRLTTVHALELDPSETDRLLRVMWRRHYHLKTIREFPHPNPDSPPDGNHDSLFALTRPWCYGIMIPFPGFPMEDCRLIPAPAILPDRAAIPPVEQGACGTLNHDSLHGCIASYFLWWDAHNWLPLERKGAFKDKSPWLHRQIGRDLRTPPKGGLGWGDVTKGLGDLSTKYLGGKYAFQLCMDYDYRPANLARLATGMNALILEVAVYKGPRYAGRHAILVLSAAADGTATISAWGLVLHGKWTVCATIKKSAARGDKRTLLPVYEFIIDNKATLPRVFAQNDLRFILGSQQWDALHFIVPQLCDAAHVKPGR